jgi:hypothetical protein
VAGAVTALTGPLEMPDDHGEGLGPTSFPVSIRALVAGVLGRVTRA